MGKRGVKIAVVPFDGYELFTVLSIPWGDRIHQGDNRNDAFLAALNYAAKWSGFDETQRVLDEWRDGKFGLPAPEEEA